MRIPENVRTVADVVILTPVQRGATAHKLSHYPWRDRRVKELGQNWLREKPACLDAEQAQIAGRYVALGAAYADRVYQVSACPLCWPHAAPDQAAELTEEDW